MLIVCTNNKGGVGKTTICFNLAYTLVEMGARVLLVDFDPQGNLTTFCRHPMNVDGGVLSLFHGEEPEVLQTHIGADLIAGHSAMTDRKYMADMVLNDLANYVSALRTITREEDPIYDFIFFDMHPTETSLHEPVLSLADFFTIPTTPDKLSNDMRLYAMSQLPDEAGVMLLVNRYRRQQNMSRAYLNMILNDDKSKDNFFLIPEEAALAKACQKSLPVEVFAKETGIRTEVKTIKAFHQASEYLMNWKKTNITIEHIGV